MRVTTRDHFKKYENGMELDSYEMNQPQVYNKGKVWHLITQISVD